MPKEYKQYGKRVQLTDAEQAAEEASRAITTEQQVDALKASAAATVAAYTYQGVAFDLAGKLAYYEGVARKAAGGLLDGLYPVRLIGTNGIVSAADADAVVAAYADMEATWMGIQLTLGAQIEVVQNG